ncbi:MAG TPA: glycosyltransferase, partial [Flavobacterium sp.]|nr:glycosyltransferase [Flavobacterium sp.]
MELEFKKSDLEIAVSTMNRASLDFLIPMFPFGSYSDFNILIINQTSSGRLLASELPNIRVINSFAKGLSKSRNLALANAQKKIVLIADDDAEYLPGFDQDIIEAFNLNKKAGLICFRTMTKEGMPNRKYRKSKFWMGSRNLIWVLSIEIAINRCNNKVKNLRFDERFGLGAQFEDSESLFFLREALEKKIKILFFPADIVVHEKYSSSDEIDSDRWFYAKSASLYRRYGIAAYLFLLKIIVFLLRKKIIPFGQAMPKMKIGLKGIN